MTAEIRSNLRRWDRDPLGTCTFVHPQMKRKGGDAKVRELTGMDAPSFLLGGKESHQAPRTAELECTYCTYQ